MSQTLDQSTCDAKTHASRTSTKTIARAMNTEHNAAKASTARIERSRPSRSLSPANDASETGPRPEVARGIRPAAIEPRIAMIPAPIVARNPDPTVRGSSISANCSRKRDLVASAKAMATAPKRKSQPRPRRRPRSNISAGPAMSTANPARRAANRSQRCPTRRPRDRFRRTARADLR